MSWSRHSTWFFGFALVISCNNTAPTDSSQGVDTVQVNELAISPAGQIYAGTEGDGVFLSADGTDSWQQVNNGLTNRFVRALIVRSNGFVFAGTRAGVFRSLDNSDTWAFVGLERTEIIALAANSSGNVYAATRLDGIFRSTSQGLGWTQIMLPNRFMENLLIDPSGKIFAATFAGLYHSLDDGASWELLGFQNIRIRALAASREGDIFAGTGDRGIFRSTDGGDTWHSLNSNVTVTSVRSLAVNADGHIFAGTFGQGIFRSLDKGETWQNIGLHLHNIRSLAIDARGRILAASLGIFLSDDNGDSWSLIKFGTQTDE